MKLGFKTVATVSGAGVMALAGMALFIPKQLSKFVLGGVPTTDAFRFMARRYAMLLGGFAALALSVRDAPPTKLRHKIAKTIAGTAAAVAAAGLYELFWGMAGPTMWVAVGAEACITAGFLATVKEKPGSYAAAAALPVDT